MNTLSLTLVTLITSVALFGCKCEDDSQSETLPITLTFTSFGGPVEGDNSCGEPPVALIRQEGTGESALLGDFTFFSQFCNNLETGEFFGGPKAVGLFTSDSGDKLFVQSGGQLAPSDDPDYDFQFQVPFSIIGGTGRYEGASGEGMTNSKVKLSEQRTDHVWSGTITLAE